ncbi:MAG TPA: glucose-1-phosphate thymidylyltransferase RfbA [Candidatus Saccharibacteria bacterium]|jgi:glucose-1-phosphate thymidylyltransferase|nr:glucose-1-phosphate thymidylyltransferase RfbA [Candidatus Saccharibacteria bacterium]
MKGIILAGGSGTRLYPITLGVSKQLIPLYDKPMIYYPLSTLMSAGIRDILIISTPQDLPRFDQLLGSGERIGVNFTYKVQEHPKGLADAFIVGADFIGDDSVAMVLGDNIFYGSDIDQKVRDAAKLSKGGVIFGAPVHDPERYGVVEFDEQMNVISIEEKPEKAKSNYAIPGLYFFDNNCIQYAKDARPSARGEIEITEIHNAYLRNGSLKVQLLDRGTAWLDTGTFASLNQASQFVQVIEERQGLKIGCIEEVAFRQGFITKNQLIEIAEPLKKSGYGQYLLRLVDER